MGDSNTNNTEEMDDDNILSRVKYRVAQPTDMLSCYEIEKSSYSKEETASKNTLQYRQHHAAKFFHVAVLHEDSDEIHYDDDEDDEIIGYICSTRYDLNSQDITQIHPLDIPKTHQPHTPTLIIHSIVVKEGYQHHGIATDMIKHYIDSLHITNMKLEKPISKVALFAKSHLLTFFLNCGFSVICPVKKQAKSQQQQKYYLELSIKPDCRSISENIGRLVGLQNNKNGSSGGGGGGGKECYIVDAFAARAGSGNPAAVVKLPPDFDPKSQSKWMQLVAAEFNLSETAFIWPCTSSSSSSSTTGRDSSSHGCDAEYDEIHWNIRYYTPTSEIPLCGHATLASASILYMTLPGNNIKESKVVFQASEDTLTMELATSSSQSQQQSQQQQPLRIVMEFPIKPAKEITTTKDQEAVKKMIQSAFFETKFGVETIDSSILFVGISEIGDILIELTPELFEEIGFIGDESVNLNALVMDGLDGYNRGVIVCCLNPDATKQQGSTDREGGEEGGGGGTGSSGSIGGGDSSNNQTTSSSSSSGTTTSNNSSVVVPDFYSRFFGPKAGIPEDPVTGSAHCVLGPYFSQKLNKTRIIGKQKSKRQGIVECEIMADHETVRLTGTAIPTVNGTLWM